MTTFSFDYDDTWTRTESVKKMAQQLRQDGHTVYLVSMRNPREADAAFREALKHVDGVVFTCRAAKQPTCSSLGIKIDIWLDDCPMFILDGAIGGGLYSPVAYLGDELKSFLRF